MARVRLTWGLAIISATLLLNACEQAGVTTKSAGGATVVDEPSGSTESGRFSIVTFQSAETKDWLKDSSNNIYTNSSTLTFTGVCQRGVSSIALSFNGTANSTKALCDKDGNYTWTASISDGTYSVEFVPINGVGSVMTGKLTLPVIVDTAAPATPVITTNAGGDFTVTSAAIQLDGTVSTDTYNIETTNSGGTLTSMTGGFRYTTSMTAGDTTTFAFRAVDFAGNKSGYASITVQYLSTGTPAAYAFSSVHLGSAITGATGKKLEAVSGPVNFLASPASASTNTLSTGMLNFQ
ncbi:MAG: hypothetical protein JST16_12920 [Bdellovibrionales bacterium]|nr:hypothetical protein [Bdellovibrionales bacterium]